MPVVLKRGGMPGARRRRSFIRRRTWRVLLCVAVSLTSWPMLAAFSQPDGGAPSESASGDPRPTPSIAVDQPIAVASSAEVAAVPQHIASTRRTPVTAAAVPRRRGLADPPQILTATPATVQSAPHSALPLGDPVVDSDAHLRGARVVAWSEGETRLLLLDRDVSVVVGSYGFRANRALARIDFEEGPGVRIHHLAIVLEDARPLRGLGPVGVEASRLLVTCATRGDVEVFTDLLQQVDAPSDEPFVAAAGERIRRHHELLERPMAQVPASQPLFGPQARQRRDDARQKIRRRDTDRLAKRLPEMTRAPAAVVVPTEPRAPTEATALTALTEPDSPATPRPGNLQSATRAVDSATVDVVAADATPAAASGDVASAASLAREGSVLFHARRIVRPGPSEAGENLLMLFGDVTVVYQNLEGGRSMSLRADRAVLFLAPDALEHVAQRSADASAVQGVYLEDNVVATDGQYTLRGPRVYFDPIQERAVVLDAVFYTWDPRRKVPIYVRAEQLRQEARNSWSARHATLTTSEFAEPHFGIASRHLTFKQRQNRDGTQTHQFTAADNTVRIGKIPVFYWPFISGSAAQVPLRRIKAGYRGKTGPEVETLWDLFALAGRNAPDGVDLTGRLDMLGDHGPAIGADLDYDLPEMRGFFESYLVIHDDSEDEIASRNDIKHDSDTRGFVLWRHRHALAENWELSLELAYVSDETFLEEFFPSKAENDKPWETSIYLKKQEEDTAFTFLVRQDLYNFLAQTTALQSSGSTFPSVGGPVQVPGYTVEKLPELGYFVLGRSIWENRLTYYSETRVSYMRIRSGKDAPEDRGFKFLQALTSFGFATPVGLPPVSFGAFNDGLGITDEYVLRFDTRHEVQAPMKVGPIDVVPFVAGRLTAYDEDFMDYVGNSEKARLWGQVGVRLHTQVSKTYDDVEIRALDVHRLRHIVEPSIDLSLSGANLNSEDLPVFDLEVERIREGATSRFGVRQTFQTERGGTGRWRTVDWVVMNTDVVLASKDTDTDTAIARFIGFRPEFSTGGDHFHSDVMWMISDTLAAVAEVNHSIEHSETPEWRLGASMEHTPRLSSFIGYAVLKPVDSRLLSYGFVYQLTRKYRTSFVHRLDIQEKRTRRIELALERKLPRWRFMVVAATDDIDDEQSIGFMLIPDGVKSSRFTSAFGPER